MKDKKELPKGKSEEVSTAKKPSPGAPTEKATTEKVEAELAKKEGEITSEKEGQASPTAESSAEEVEPIKPVRDLFPYLGTDSTSVVNFEILGVDEEDEKEEKEQVKAWFERTKGPNVDANVEIKSGVELAQGRTIAYNTKISATGEDLILREIDLGKIFHRLKKLTKAANLTWGPWAEENLTFVSKRTRERCMLLASRPESQRFAFLGVERLELLIGATKDSKDPDAIKTLLAQYEIVYDPKAEVNLAEFKHLIDSAVNSERLTKNGTKVDFEKVRNLTALGIQFDRSFLKRLKDIQESGGSVETYLDKRSIGMGAEAEETAGERRLADVNTLSNRLIKTLDYVSKDEEELEKLDMKTIDLLWKKLNEIRKMKNPAEEESNEQDK